MPWIWAGAGGEMKQCDRFEAKQPCWSSENDSEHAYLSSIDQD